MLEQFMAAMDVQQGDWYIRLADRQDLEAFAYATAHELIYNQRMQHERPVDIDKATNKLRRQTADRLFIVLRAAVQSGMVKEKA